MSDDQEKMIPYIVIKFSNGDVVLAEFVEETFTAMVVRYPIHVRKAYVTNEHGVKVQKKISSKYCELAYKDEIVVQKPSCNYITPLRYQDRKYYEILVAYHFFRKRKSEEAMDIDEDSTEEKKEESSDSKQILH